MNLAVDALRKGFKATKNFQIWQYLYQLQGDNDTAIWSDIKMALSDMYTDYNVWTYLIDFAVNYKIKVAQKQLGDDLDLPTITSLEWRQWFNAGLNVFPNCPGLLYLRALSYLDEYQDGSYLNSSFNGSQFSINIGLLCTERLLQESLYYAHLTTSKAMKDLFMNDVVQQNLNWTTISLQQLDDVHLLPFDPIQRVQFTQENCFPLRRISAYYSTTAGTANDTNVFIPAIGRHPIHQAALLDAYAVLGRSEDQKPPLQRVDPAYILPTTCGSASTGCLMVQVGCSNPGQCARLPWVVLDAVATLSTWMQSSANDLSMLPSSSVHLLYSSHTLEHLSHYTRDISLPDASSGL